jgi:plastocyanin
MAFGEPLTVAPGATITVVSKDFDGSEQGTFTAPTQPGEYAFYCKYHLNMKRTLIVKVGRGRVSAGLG